MLSIDRHIDALLHDYERGLAPLRSEYDIENEVCSVVQRLRQELRTREPAEEFIEAMNDGVLFDDPVRGEILMRVRSFDQFVEYYVMPLVRRRLRDILEGRRTHASSDPGGDIGVNDALPPDAASEDFPAGARDYRPAESSFRDDEPHLRITRSGEPAPRMPHRYNGKKVVKIIGAIVVANLLALGMLGAFMPRPQDPAEQKKKADPPLDRNKQRELDALSRAIDQKKDPVERAMAIHKRATMHAQCGWYKAALSDQEEALRILRHQRNTSWGDKEHLDRTIAEFERKAADYRARIVP